MPVLSSSPEIVSVVACSLKAHTANIALTADAAAAAVALLQAATTT